MKAREVNAALYRHFVGRYAVITEVTCKEAAATGGMPWPRDRRCDVLLVNKTERIAVEVKVSRSDLLGDLADPDKQAAWTALTHRQAYAVPESLVAVALERVPATFGVLAVGDRTDHHRISSVRWARRAPKRKAQLVLGEPADDPGPLPFAIVYTLLIRLAAAEAHAKGHGWSPDGEATVEELRAKVERLARDLELAESKRARAEARALEWRKAYAASAGVECATCHTTLMPKFGKYGADWKHRSTECEQLCYEMRKDAAKREAVEHGHDPHAAYLYVPHPHPLEPLTDDAEAV